MNHHLIFILLDTGTVLGGLIGAIITLPIAFLLICYLLLAPHDILFSFAKENRVKYIMSANGKKWTTKTIFSSNKYYIDPITYDILPITPDTPKKYYRRWNFFGMYWVGIPPFVTIYKYMMSWMELQLVGDVYKLVPRKETTPYLFVKRTAYAIFVKEAEDSEGYPLDLLIELYVRATNARTPIFDVDDAFGQLITLTLRETGRYVKTSTFAGLLSERVAPVTNGGVSEDAFSKFICALNDKISGETESGGIRKKLGFIIEGAGIITVELGGELKGKIADATTKAAIAIETKKERITLAEAEAEAMNLITQAKKNRYGIFKNEPEATAIEIAEKTFSGNLTTYAPGGDTTKTIPIK